MSDFDGPLERLLLDPEFKAALAANPDRILAGYHLDPEQRDRGAAGGPDEAFNKRYPHLDHYKSAYAQGTRFYDDQGTPAQPGTGRAVRGAAPPRPGRARRRHRDRAPAGSLTVPVRE